MASNLDFLRKTSCVDFFDTYGSASPRNHGHQLGSVGFLDPNHVAVDNLGLLDTFGSDISVPLPSMVNTIPAPAYPVPCDPLGIPLGDLSSFHWPEPFLTPEPITISPIELTRIENSFDYCDQDGVIFKTLGPNSVPTPMSQFGRPAATPLLIGFSRSVEEGRRYTCSLCPDAFFKNPKDTRRHVRTVHPTGQEPMYSCRCGKQDYRKDNHKRHVLRCHKECSLGCYICVCQSPCNKKQLHVAHLDGCIFGQAPRGRPRAY
ncbi:hypothetical protein F4777DRAFT_378721 [Nemania sp. FL0916]|nr:hypothetical protein F4777DRAFT_378721 [Nemania sp. FL0916]